jgi:hypothetical protein
MPIRHKSIKMVRKDRLKRFFDPRLIEAIRHPVRAHILAVLNERIASTVEIGDEIELDVTAFNKQVKFLDDIGCIEEVGNRPVRGATEHFFRAKTTAIFDERAWKDMPETLKADLDLGFVQSLIDDLIAALKGRTFHARNDKHTSWTPTVFDRIGWREAMKLLEATLTSLLEIQRRSGERMLRSGEPGIPATVGILGFQRCPEYMPPLKDR